MKPQSHRNHATILLGALIACFVGFYNQYPLIYPDTGTYLASGYSGEIPVDRSIFYGLFLRHISLSASPWLIILVQGWLTSWILHLSFGLFFTGLKRNLLFLGSIVLLTFTTGFSYNVSILIPDIFCATALLSLINLLLHTRLSRYEMVGLVGLFAFSLSVHFSNLPIFFLLLLGLLGLYGFQKMRKKSLFTTRSRLAISLITLTVTLVGIPTVHYAIDGEFQYSKGSHVFIVNHLIECGVMEEFLKDECENSNYQLCAYQDELNWNFIWKEDSPFYKTGGWLGTRKEYNAMISDILSNPKYWPLLIQKTIEYTAKQWFTFETTVSTTHDKHNTPYGQIHWRFHDSVHEYVSSKQLNNNLDLSRLNAIENGLVLFSLVFLFAVSLYPALHLNLPTELRWTIVILLFYSILSALICSNLSTIVPRYQNRWIWLAPMYAIICGSMFLQSWLNKRKNKEIEA